MNRIIHFSFFLLFSTNAYSEIHFFEAKEISPLYSDHFSHLSPLEGLIHLKTDTLKNYRFYGEYGLHPHADFPSRIGTRQGMLPQSARADLIQRLFPSPDRLSLVPNQIPSDPISRLTPILIGRLLQKLHSQKTSKLSPELLKHEIGMMLFEEIYPERFRSLFESLTTQDEFKEYQNLKQNYDELLKAPTTDYSRWKSILSQIDETESRFAIQIAEAIQTLSFKNEKRKKWQEIESFSRSLVQAFLEQENRSAASPSLYPDHLVERSLLGYFWSRANRKAEILELNRGMPDFLSEKGRHLFEDASEQERWLKNVYTQADYHPSPSMSLLLETLQDPELRTFLFLSQRLLENEFIPLLSYGTATVDLVSFPDCAETALRNLINRFLFDPLHQRIDLNRLRAITHRFGLKTPLLEAYYTRFNTFQELTSEAARNAWATLISHADLGAESFLRPSTEPFCELNPTLSNLLRSLSVLLGDTDTPQSLGQVQSIESKLDRLCEIFSSERGDYSWKEKQSLTHSLEVGSAEVEIQFKGAPLMAWVISYEEHAAVVDLSKRKNAPWIRNVPFSTKDPSILSWLVNADLYKTMPIHSVAAQHDQNQLLWNLSLENFNTRLSLIRHFLTQNRETAFPLIRSWISPLSSMDLSHQIQVLSVFVQSGQEKSFENELRPAYESLFKNPGFAIAYVHEFEGKTSLLWPLIQQALEQHPNPNPALLGDSRQRRSTLWHHLIDSAPETLQSHLIQTVLRKSPNNLHIYNESGFAPIHLAIQKRIPAARLFLSDPSSLPDLPMLDSQATPLHVAVKVNYPEAVQTLLENHANPNLQDRFGYTPLGMAVSEKNAEFIRILLEKGADPRIEDEFGNGPLHYVFRGPIALKINPIDAALFNRELSFTVAKNLLNSQDLEMAETLIQAGAQDHPNHEGDTALHAAVSRGNLKAVEALLKAGSSPNAQNRRKNTPLLLATLGKEFGLAKVLIEAGASPNLENLEGTSPLSLAHQLKKQDLIALYTDAPLPPTLELISRKNRVPFLPVQNPANAFPLSQRGVAPFSQSLRRVPGLSGSRLLQFFRRGFSLLKRL